MKTKNKPKWVSNPRTVADVIQSLQSLGYDVSTSLQPGTDPKTVRLDGTPKQRRKWRAIKPEKAAR